MHRLICRLRFGHYLTLSCWLCALPCLLNLGPIAKAQDQSLIQRFLGEAAGQWDQYAVFARRLQGKSTFKRTVDGTITLQSATEVKQNGTCKLCIRQFVNSTEFRKQPSRGYAWAFNPRYSFALYKKTEQHPWVITETNFKAGTGQDAAETAESSVAGMTRELIRVGRDFLPDLVKQPAFRVLKAQATQDALVQIDFDNTHSLTTDSKLFFPAQRGQLVLDPNRSWCLREAKLFCKYRGLDADEHIKCEFRDTRSPYPIPSRVVVVSDMTDTSDQTRKHMASVAEFYLEDGPLPGDEHFTLKAFGFPEPAPIERGTPWYIWIALAGLISLVAGVLFRYAKHRTT